ncbi:MAG: hypothetical protein UT66_C0036G0025 [candidate division CPR2 bacterium GW2011_GWC1_39_9]|uniref:Ribonuclease J n=1 Tax=candidate division CPR2 bacterium GW2011_GWC2_39_10 TaxID=1618345 RepID=A0A0G0PAQ1_UNCC2|nr:MAG: hypothetical protein UT18_C0003G0058 [candidate division CPR2 bacterium GW2011_GWC2_39_10]KKR33616.1 MAG: hypothetical protein UT66_C0036G0025 [candidate division CPR2 bacterium GW2011_GWC1_39_9]
MNEENKEKMDASKNPSSQKKQYRSQGPARKGQVFESKAENLKIIPLGGMGEIGKNMYIFEYGNDILIVDCGFMFPPADMPGVDYIIPDVSYLEENKSKVRAYLITHGHEDHVGGLPYVLPKIPAPIYAPRLTAGLIQNKLKEFKIMGALAIRTVDPDKDEKLTLGAFQVEFIRMTHSIPDAVALAIHTPVGVVIATGDYRFDFTPVDGKLPNIHRLVELSKQGVLALFGDSTGSEAPGYSGTETSLQKNFDSILSSAKGRVIIATFASQINRIQQFVNATVFSGRKLAISGRSLLNNIEVAVRLGYLKIPAGLIIKVQDINKYPDTQVAVISTGSQGEAMSALARMASGDHQQIKIRKGDTVIFSSSPIPGNESAITDVIDDLFREGAEVIYDEKDDIKTHVSGHSKQEELKLMLALVRPKYFVPYHGEYHHLIHHRDLAIEMGIPEQNIFVVDNGQVIEFGKDFAKLNGKVKNGIILVDGLGVGDVQNIVLRDRNIMSTDGIFVVIATVDKVSGRLLTSPDIISRGFIYMRESEQLVNNARSEVRRILSKKEGEPPANWLNMKNRLREEIGRFLYNNTKRQPMVIPVIIEV